MRVVAVVVAYNRAELLRECLDALAKQSHPLAGLVVVDNASTDGSAETARTHPAAPDLVALERNTGGAGGFAAGAAHAVTAYDVDYLWLLDDDTIPEPEALAALVAAVEGYPGRVSIAGSRVLWTDGRDHPMNTPRRRPRVDELDVRRAQQVGAEPVRSSSFVSMLVSVDAVRRHGLPVADYFIWNDDFEFSCRVLRAGVGLAVPASRVEHRTRTFGTTDADPGDRFFYEVRNKTWLLTRSPALSATERVVYAGASVRRWTRTMARSTDRRRLLRAAGRGLRDGLRAGPRPTTQVLAGLGPVSDDVAAVERASGRGG